MADLVSLISVWIIVISFFNSLFCKIYYVDSVNGDESYNGLSQQEPFKTISQVNDEMSNFIGGDEILFHVNSEWQNEQLHIDHIHGTFTEKIRFGTYGGNGRPTISAGYEIEELFTLENGNIFSVHLPTFSSIRQVFVNGIVLNVSHTPSEKNDFFYIDADSSQLRTKSSFPLVEADIVDSQVVIRPKRWEWWGATVTGYSTNVISLSHAYHYTFTKNYGFFFQNKYSFMEKGTWYFNSVTNMLYVWLSNNESPNDNKIILNSQNYGIFIDHSSHIIVDSFTIPYARRDGIRTSNGEHIVIENNMIHKCGERGISTFSSSNITIRNNNISDIAWVGMRIEGEHNIIEYNYVTNIFLNPFAFLIISDSEHIGGHGIYTRCLNAHECIIRYNVFKNIGYIGIAGYGGHNNIHNNYIYNGCMFTDDCGLIYQWQTSWNKIHENVIVNSIGNNYGTPSFFFENEMKNIYSHSAQGIYLDDGSGNTSVTNNVIINVQYGVFFHNAQYNYVANNIIFNARQHALLAVEDTIWNVSSWTRENIAQYNILHTNSNEKATIRESGNLGWTNMIQSDHNYYTPYEQNGYVVEIYNGKTKIRTYYETLQDYFEHTGNDEHSKFIGDDWYDIVKFTYDIMENSTNLIYNGEFNNDKSGWSNGWVNPGANVYTQWSDKYGGSMESYFILDKKVRTEKHRGDIMSSTSVHFEIKDQQDYVIRFSAMSTLQDDIEVIVRKCASNYAVVGFKELIPVNPNARDYEYIFKGTLNHTDSCIYFHSGLTINATYYMDNVSLHEVNVNYNDLKDDFTLIYNEENVAKYVYFDINVAYCDLDGNAIYGGVWIEPNSAIFFVNCFCNNDHVCNNYENANTCPNDCDPVCGNMVCEVSEDIFSCPVDCLIANGMIFVLILSIFFIVCFMGFLIVMVIVIIVMSFKCFNVKKGFDKDVSLK